MVMEGYQGNLGPPSCPPPTTFSIIIIIAASRNRFKFYRLEITSLKLKKNFILHMHVGNQLLTLYISSRKVWYLRTVQ